MIFFEECNSIGDIQRFSDEEKNFICCPGYFTSMKRNPCPRCGFENPSDFRFCGECGRRIPSTEEHARAVSLCHDISHALGNHLAGWAGKSGAQRASMRATFERHAGMSPAKAALRMQKLEQHLRGKEYAKIAALDAPIKELAVYFDHVHSRLREVETDPKKRKEAEREIAHCAEAAIDLANLVASFAG